MPQLEQLASYPSQIFWLIVTFSLLYIILAKRTLPLIREVLQGRQERITNDLEKAEIVKQQAEEAKSDYSSALDNSRKEAHDLMLSATKTINDEAQKRNAELDKTLAEQMDEAQSRVAGAHLEAVKSIEPVAAEVAQLMIKKLTGREVSTDKVSPIIKRFMDTNDQSQGDTTCLMKSSG